VNRRLLTVAAAAAAIVALVLAAVPAFAGNAVAPTLDRQASARALAKAKRAVRQAREARRMARGAGDRADAARAKANAATALGDENRSQLATMRSQLEALKEKVNAPAPLYDDIVPEQTKVASASVAALVTTSSPFGDFEALGGPAVQAHVPASGLIEVWAQVGIEEEDGGAVGLYEDGQKITGISAELCGEPSVDDGSALIDMTGGPNAGEFMTAATPPTPGFLGCASGGAPAPVLLSRAPGNHTYELRYSECSCNFGTGAEFRDRVLRVAPRP
jgi:hypothetical protein